MKCNMDCANCKLPARKCHGGNEKTPYVKGGYLPYRIPTGPDQPTHASSGRKVGKQGVCTKF